MKKYIVSIVIPLAIFAAVVFVAQPMSAQAASAQEVVDLLVRLGIIPSDKADQAGKAVSQLDNPSQGASCHSFGRNLGIGSSGDDVVRLINLLSAEGVLPFRVSTYNDSYDESIASAVTAFQEKYASEILVPNGLVRGTGYVGVSTRAKLNRLCITATPNNTPDQPLVRPSVSISSPDGGSYPAGSNMTVKWSKKGSIPSGSYYFVYLKTSSAQVLGGTNPGTYYPVIFRQASLQYPSLNIALPTDLNAKGSSPIIPGTYYLEIDVTDANGVPFASATSNAFTVTSSNSSDLVITSVGSPGNPNFEFYPGDRVTIVGSGFNSASYVAWGGVNGISIKPTSFTSYNLTFIAPDVDSGNYTIQVIEKAGSEVSNTVSVKVVLPSTPDPASIDPTTLKVIPGESFTLSGHTLVKKDSLTIAIVGPSYSGSTSWYTIGNLVKGDAGLYTAVSKNISPDGTNWSATFGGLGAEGHYTVLVYDDAYNILASNVLWVTLKG
jgi:hypothetical protein